MILSTFVIAAVLLPAAVWGQTAAPQCELNVERCLNDTDQRLQVGLSNYDFASVCRALKSRDSCYSQGLGDPQCSSVRSTLDTWKTQNMDQLNAYCPNDQPHPCLRGLKKCSDAYQHVLPARSVTALCLAVDTANQCANNLQCPAQLQMLVMNFEQKISREVTLSNCTRNNPAASVCEKDAATCLAPVERLLKVMSAAYNFDEVCRSFGQLQICTTHFQNDNRCSTQQKQNMLTKMTALSNKYRVFCDSNGNPLPCVSSLKTCTTQYTTNSLMPQITKDTLFMCQVTSALVDCLTPLQKNTTSCPAMQSVQASAVLQKTEAMINQNCGTVLTACTKTAAQCVVDKDVKMQNAEELGQYNKMCTLSADFKKCMDPYLAQPACAANQYLAFETTYINNITSIICQANQPLLAKPCLQQVSSCASPYVNALEHDLTKLCSAQKSFADCLDKVNCPGQGLEAQLLKARQTATQSECKNAASLEKAAAFSMTLTLLVTAVLRS